VFEQTDRLQELFERKESITSKMDSFQIVEEIQEIIMNLLRAIFSPYSLEKVPRRNLTHIPDAMLRFTPLGGIKNRVFFEIKARKMAYYDIETIREMTQGLKSIYSHRFHSLVFVCRGLDRKIVDRARILFEREDRAGKIAFLSVDTLVDLYQRLMTDSEFGRPKYKESFLANLLQTEGILSSRVIASAREYTKVFEEYKFEETRADMLTRDRATLSLATSFNVEVEDEQLFVEIEARAPTLDNVKSYALRTIEDWIQGHSLLELAFETEPMLSNLERDLDFDMKQRGLKLEDFRCYWKFDESARKNIERSRQLVNQSESLRQEIDSLYRKSTKTYDYWRAKIDDLSSSLESLNADYVRGIVTREDYLKRIDAVTNRITTLKAEIDKYSPTHAQSHTS